MRRNWTDEEISLLRSNLHLSNLDLYKLIPSKTKDNVRNFKATFLKGWDYKKDKRYWRTSEKELLKAIYPHLPVARLLPLFPGRRYSQMVNMYRRIS